MPKVSVIVPVYNVEKYLARCIDSILAQTFTDFELILIDDGSPDRCGEICDEYAKKDSRIKVIHKQNGGVSAARNSAIEAAQGKYLMCCDADDTVPENWCKNFVEAIEKYPDAWIVSNASRVYPDNSEKIIDNHQDAVECIDYFAIYKKGLSAFSCNKIFDLQRIKSNNIRYEVGRTNGEDVLFNIDYYKHCKSVYYIKESLYNYYYPNDDEATAKYRPNAFEQNLALFDARLEVIKKEQHPQFCDMALYFFLTLLDNTMDKRNKMPLLKKLAYNQRMMRTKEFTYCVNTATGKNDSELFMKILRMRNYYILYLFNKLVNKKT